MRAALYARVSTERQERQQTIDSQFSALRAWAAAGCHDVTEAHVFRDEGYSGGRLDRPGLDALRDAVRDGAVGIVAVLTPDRLARKYAYQVLLLEEFRRAGVEVVFLQHPISDDPNDQLLLQIQGAIAEYERAVMGERFRRGKLQRLLLGGSYWVSGWWRASCHESRNQGAEQGFAAAACVVHELEEAEVERQLVLRDAAVRAQPGAQQRPEALDGVDVDFAEAITVLVARILAAGVADRLVPVAPGRKAGVDVVLVGMNESVWCDGILDDRLDRGLLYVGQHLQYDLSTTLDQPEDRRLVLLLRAPPGHPLQPAAPSWPPLFATSAGWPLCPATT